MVCEKVSEFLATTSIESLVEGSSSILKALYLKFISKLYVSIKESHKKKGNRIKAGQEFSKIRTD